MKQNTEKEKWQEKNSTQDIPLNQIANLFFEIIIMSSFCIFSWIECFGSNPIVLIAISSASLLSERIFSVFDLDLKD